MGVTARVIMTGCLALLSGCSLAGCSLADLGFTAAQRDAIRPAVRSIAADNATDPGWEEFGPYVAAVLAYPILRAARRKLRNPVVPDAPASATSRDDA